MTVNQDFPFECCEKCKSIRPYTNKQILYSAEEVVDIELSIGCENEQQCLELRKMILNETMMVELKNEVCVVPKITLLGRNKRCHCYECTICGEDINFEQKYCSGCGKPIKWD